MGLSQTTNIKQMMPSKTQPQALGVIDWGPYRLLAWTTPLRKDVNELIQEYETFSTALKRSHGYVTSTKVLKDLYGRAKLLAIGVIPQSEPFGGIWFTINRQTGLPRRMPTLRRLLQGTVHQRRLALSVLSSVETLRVTPSTCIETITGPYTGKVTALFYWKEELRRITSKYFRPLEKELPETRYHMSTSAGPNHGPAIIDSGLDALMIYNDRSLLDLFTRSCEVFKRDDLKEAFDKVIDGCSELGVTLKKTRYPARLFYLPDKAGKTRVVYSLTWWFQEILHPLHRDMYNLLYSIKQDGTSGHDRASSTVRKWTCEGRRLWSVDLTAATDRFPIDLQIGALSGILDQSSVEIWEQIMGIKPWSDPHNRYVMYAVGQPMGAKTSWATFAITHHAFLYALCEKHGVSVKDSYVIVGDDIVIANDAVAKDYMDTLKILGVDYSPSKTISPNRAKASVAEFAKRLFRNGLELTPLTSQLLKQTFTNHSTWLMVDLIREMERKWGDGFLVTPGKLHLSAPAFQLYNSLSRSWKERIAASICFLSWEKRVEYNESTLTSPRGWTQVSNPFGDVQELTRYQIMYTVVGDRLSQSLSKLYELILVSRKGSLAQTGREDLVHTSFHPIHLVMNRLDDVTKVASEKFSSGELSFNEVMDLGLDIGYLVNLFEKGMSYRSWRDLKDRRSRTAVNLAVTTLKGCLNPEEFYSDYIE